MWNCQLCRCYKDPFSTKKCVQFKTTLINIDLENIATSWFIQNSMKPNPHKYQAMVLGKTEDKLNFKLADDLTLKPHKRLVFWGLG